MTTTTPTVTFAIDKLRPLHVFLATESPVKRRAVERALQQLNLADYKLVCIQGITSSVPEQPIGLPQTHQGAENRLAKLIEIVNGIGPDGGFPKTSWIALSIESGMVELHEENVGVWGDVAAIHAISVLPTTQAGLSISTTPSEHESAFVPVPAEHQHLLAQVMAENGKVTLGQLLFETGCTTDPKAWFDRETQLSDAIYEAINCHLSPSV